MDIFDLLILLFIAFPVLSRLLSKARKQQKQTPEPRQSAPGRGQAAPPDEEDAFQRAIREIQQALSGEPVVESGQDSQVKAEPDWHSSESRQETFAAEERFERAGVSQGRQGKGPRRVEHEFLPLRRVQIQSVSAQRKVRKRKTRPREKIGTKLRDRHTAREAVVFAELLGSPVGLRKQS